MNPISKKRSDLFLMTSGILFTFIARCALRPADQKILTFAFQSIPGIVELGWVADKIF